MISSFGGVHSSVSHVLSPDFDRPMVRDSMQTHDHHMKSNNSKRYSYPSYEDFCFTHNHMRSISPLVYRFIHLLFSLFVKPVSSTYSDFFTMVNHLNTLFHSCQFSSSLFSYAGSYVIGYICSTDLDIEEVFSRQDQIQSFLTVQRPCHLSPCDLYKYFIVSLSLANKLFEDDQYPSSLRSSLISVLGKQNITRLEICILQSLDWAIAIENPFDFAKWDASLHFEDSPIPRPFRSFSKHETNTPRPCHLYGDPNIPLDKLPYPSLFHATTKPKLKPYPSQRSPSVENSPSLFSPSYFLSSRTSFVFTDSSSPSPIPPMEELSYFSLPPNHFGTSTKWNYLSTIRY